MSKKSCPISRDHFRNFAKALNVTIAGHAMIAEVKEFSTGSLGWYVNGKITVPVPGTTVGFRSQAKDIQVTINGVPFVANPKEFSSGSRGWYGNGKINVDVGGIRAQVQIGLNLTQVGTKGGEEVGGTPQVQIGMNITLVGSKELVAVAA